MIEDLTLITTKPECPGCGRPLGKHNRVTRKRPKGVKWKAGYYYCLPCQRIVHRVRTLAK